MTDRLLREDQDWLARMMICHRAMNARSRRGEGFECRRMGVQEETLASLADARTPACASTPRARTPSSGATTRPRTERDRSPPTLLAATEERTATATTWRLQGRPTRSSTHAGYMASKTATEPRDQQEHYVLLAMDPKFGSFAIYEHCLPFNVSRAFDEASGINDPVIWTAERDRQMWEALQG